MDRGPPRNSARSPADAAPITCSLPRADRPIEPVEAAVKLARDRARVVDIGKMKLDLPWNAYYEKELDVRFSRSYGPGRYDDRYELEGIDYPAGYVRWTEKRNLESFLDLVARNRGRGGDAHLGRLPDSGRGQGLRGPEVGRTEGRRRPARVSGGRRGRSGSGDEPRAPRAPGDLGPAPPVSGESAGRGRLHRRRQLRVVDAAAQPGQGSRPLGWRTSRPPGRFRRPTLSGRFGFTTGSTTADAVLEDSSLDAIFIVTRHQTHAQLVCRALETGKAVFVEKPLALTRDEVDTDRRHHREDRQRPAHGGVQPAIRAAAGADEEGFRNGQRQLGDPVPG